MPSEKAVEPVDAARLLLRRARAATLATVTEGQPFASLITPAPTPDGAVLMLLSGLSEHTRHLQTEPRCSLLLAEAGPELNPQANARLTLTGLAAPEPDLALKKRWIDRHPYAAFYAGFADFVLWRVRPVAGLYIGGFASATRLRQADLTPDPAAVAAVAEAEAEIMAHCNADHPDTLTLLAQHGHPAIHEMAGPPWTMTACDVDGCDLTQNEVVRRVEWPAPVPDASGVRRALILLARAAKNSPPSDVGHAE